MGGFYCGNKKIRIADSSKGMFGKSYFFGVRPSRDKAGQTSERTTAEGNFMEGTMIYFDFIFSRGNVIMNEIGLI